MRHWVCALSVWLVLGLSLGWYYTFTYYGLAGWPMPLAEACAGIILYYFSVLNIDTEGQGVHWMLTFPVAGTLWTFSLILTARYFGVDRPSPGRTAFLLSLASVPLILPAPWMSLIAAQTADGLSWDRMIAVALRRGNVRPEAWLTPMYFALGLLGLGIQIAVYRKLFVLRGRRAVLHFLCAAIVLVGTSCVSAAAVAIPLRFFLE